MQYKSIFQAQEISLPHADALLATEYTMSHANECFIKNIAKPKELFSNIVVAANMYNRTMTLIWDCLVICGLKKYTVSI